MAAGAAGFLFSGSTRSVWIRVREQFPTKASILASKRAAHPERNKSTATKTRRKTLFAKHIRRNASDVQRRHDLTGGDVTGWSRSKRRGSNLLHCVVCAPALLLCYLPKWCGEIFLPSVSQNDASFRAISVQKSSSWRDFPQILSSDPDASVSAGFGMCGAARSSAIMRASHFNAFISLDACMWSSFHVV